MARTIIDLPYEIFDVVLDFLAYNNNDKCCYTRDILQIQLTCKTLLQASTERLYKTVNINSKEAANLFIQSTTNGGEAARGRLVKKVILGENLIRTADTTEEKRQSQSFLMNLYKYCSNLVEIEGLCNDKKIIWNSLLNAATFGHLKHLQVVQAPKHYGDEAKLYMHTVLTFRETLTRLEVFDETIPPQVERDVLQLTSLSSTSITTTTHLQNYNTLSSRLAEFKNLKLLTLTRRVNNSNKNMLIEFDSMIDSCPKLIEFRFIRRITASVDTSSTIITDTPATKHQIQARPNIKSFYGFGKVIGNDKSMEYLMQKFPKLDSMTILLKHNNSLKGDDPVEFSGAAMTNFLGYMSKIPSVFVEIILANDAILDLWTNMMNNLMMQTKKEPGTQFRNRIIIDYNGSHPYLLKKLLFIKRPLSTISSISSGGAIKQEENLTTTLYLPPFVSSFSFDGHKQLIENFGPTMFQKLTITQMKNMQLAMERKKQLGAQCGGAWLDHVFTNCSSLTNLTIITPGYIAFQENSKLVLNESLKSLIIEDLQTVAVSSANMELDIYNYRDRDTTDKIFNDMSLRLPELENLHLHSVYGKDHKKLTTIDMPHTSFDTFIWSRSLQLSTTNLGSIQKEESWKVHTKITNSKSGKEVFYIANQSQIILSSREAYEGAISSNNDSGHYFISICCKSLKHIEIKIEDASDSQWFSSLSLNIE